MGQEIKAYPHYSCVKKNYGAADHFFSSSMQQTKDTQTGFILFFLKELPVPFCLHVFSLKRMPNAG